MEIIQVERRPESPGVPVDEVDMKVKVKKLPAQYFDFISSRADKQHVGSLLTVENLKTIRRYASTVHALPRDLEEIKEAADFDSLKIEAEKIYELYSALHRHVHEWDKLERQIKELGPELELFAHSMVQRGGALLEKLENSEVYQAIAEQKSSQGIEFTSYILAQAERDQLRGLIEKGLTGLIREIEDTSGRIADVDKRADWFAMEISRELRPRMKKLLNHIDEKLDDNSVAEMHAALEELDNRIALLKSAYDTQVGYAFTGLLLGPIGLIVTGGVFGSKAEETRAEKNILIEQRRQSAEALRKIAPAKKNFESIHTTIRDLEFRCKDLSVATKRLADVWLFLNSYAKLSINESKELSSSRDIESFVQDFSEVIKPWERIGNISHQLSNLFNELLEESTDV